VYTMVAVDWMPTEDSRGEDTSLHDMGHGLQMLVHHSDAETHGPESQMGSDFAGCLAVSLLRVVAGLRPLMLDCLDSVGVLQEFPAVWLLEEPGAEQLVGPEALGVEPEALGVLVDPVEVVECGGSPRRPHPLYGAPELEPDGLHGHRW
jgi:hypothetical protein